MANWPMIVTALLASYGAILSTYSIFAARKEKRYQVKVEVSIGFNTRGFPMLGDKVGPTVLFVVASNPGHRTVRLASVGLRLPQKRQMFLDLRSFDAPLPYDLEPGRNYRGWVEGKTVADTLKAEGFHGTVKIHGFFRDALGQRFGSKTLKFDCEQSSR